MTGNTENITNATVLGLSVVPSLPPPPPQPPVVPPAYQNVSDDIVIIQPEEVAPPIIIAQATNDTGEPVIDFVFPASMRVTMEPHTEVYLLA